MNTFVGHLDGEGPRDETSQGLRYPDVIIIWPAAIHYHYHIGIAEFIFQTLQVRGRSNDPDSSHVSIRNEHFGWGYQIPEEVLEKQDKGIRHIRHRCYLFQRAILLFLPRLGDQVHLTTTLASRVVCPDVSRILPPPYLYLPP